MFRLWYEVRAGTLSRREFVIALQANPAAGEEVLDVGSRSEHRKTCRTCQRIMRVEKCLWTFVRVEGVEPTNNAAERAFEKSRAVAKEKLRDAERERVGVCREDTNSG